MTRVGVGEAPGGQVDLGDDRGEEAPGPREPVEEEPTGRAEGLGGAVAAPEGRPDGGLEHRREQRAGHALAADVAHDDDEPARVAQHDVVDVATGIAGGQEGGGEGPAPGQCDRRRQEGLLDMAGLAHLVGVAHLARAAGAPGGPGLPGTRDGGRQRGLAAGLAQEAVGPEPQGVGLEARLTRCRHDDDADLVAPRAQGTQELAAGQAGYGLLGHQDVGR